MAGVSSLNNNDDEIDTRPPQSNPNQQRDYNSASPQARNSNSDPAITPDAAGADAADDDYSDVNMDDPEQAAAAAEVSVMERASTDNRRVRDTTNDEAILGAAANDEGGAMVGAFEIIDESAELVKQRFLQFLVEYCERVPTTNQNGDGATNDEENNDEDDIILYPYAEQATQMARGQLKRGSANPEDDDDNNMNSQASSTSSVFANTLFLDFRHVINKDIELAEAIQSDFCRFEPFLRQAIQTFVLDLHPELLQDDPASSSGGGSASALSKDGQSYFLAVHNLPTTLSLRKLRTDKIGRLSCVSGTVTRTSEVRPELLVGTFRCNKCGLIADNIQQQYHYTRPTLCRNPRCSTTSPKDFTLDIQQSQFVDWQKLRVQENSDEIPPGSMPRSMDVIVRNEMVERAKAGDKCVFTGSLVVIPDGSALARAGEAPRSTNGRGGGNRPNDAATGGGGGVRGLAALGVKELTYRMCFVASSVVQADALFRTLSSNRENHSIASILFGNQALESHDLSAEEVAMEFTRAERDEIRRMKSSPRLYEQMVDSIAPTTFGHREVKKGILLMLLGGVHKTTEDGIKLRGDINVCIVGDPSTAKSQFLKYVHAFLPSRAVYTSGKASSAAGLTAAVQRDQDTGEYCIEAGALMLADNGYCMIDEFDKMDPSDQVAIHEAMEQQTISITKAGIQATLNARASILAAANPIYGRYDRTKTLKANVALSAPILSRFDLFFVVLDDCNPHADNQVARHILKVHRCCDDDDETIKPPFTKEQLQRYIRLARTITPKITPESQKIFVDCYRKLRQGDTLGRSRSAYRITVRQLESLVRLSEALARLHCDNFIQPSYVREAFRLLKTSIIRVETSDVEMEEDDDDGDDNNDNDNDNNNGDDDDDSKNTSNVDNTNDDSQGYPGEVDESQNTRFEPETQAFSHFHRGEYNENNLSAANTHALEDEPLQQPEQQQQEQSNSTVAVKQEKSNLTKKKTKTKSKTKITFEEYEAITNAIATHLRSLEEEQEAEEDSKASSYMKWCDVVEWYLEKYCEQDIGDSIERLEEMRKKINLVIRRLVYNDNVLVTVGGDGDDDDDDNNDDEGGATRTKKTKQKKKEQQQAMLAVHPNYVVS